MARKDPKIKELEEEIALRKEYLAMKRRKKYEPEYKEHERLKKAHAKKKKSKDPSIGNQAMSDFIRRSKSKAKPEKHKPPTGMNAFILAGAGKKRIEVTDE